jgi:hypothetical protein
MAMAHEAEELALAIWSQQWPRLRHSFRSCTLSGADRSSPGADFDLQMVPPQETSIRSRFPKAFEPSWARLPGGDWVEVAVDDLCSDVGHELRTFFRRVGGDLANGRAAFASLCRLHQFLRRLDHDDRLARAIKLTSEALALATASSAPTRAALAASSIRFARSTTSAAFSAAMSLQRSSGVVGQRGEKRGGATGGAQVPGIRHLE